MIEGCPEMSSEREYGDDQRSDTDLLKACLTRDQDAWAVLVERYHRLIFSIGRRQGLTSEDSADLVQNVLTIVLRRLETIQDLERFSAWLITTAKREAWRLHRHAPLSDALDEVGLVDDQPLPEDEVMAWERAALVRVALNGLTATCRELVAALFFEQQTPSYAELSERLRMPVGSIGPTRARCFAKLATELETLGVIDPAAVALE